MRVHGTHTFESTPPEGLYPSIPELQPIREPEPSAGGKEAIASGQGSPTCDRVSRHPTPSEGSAEVASHRTDEAGIAETQGFGASAVRRRPVLRYAIARQKKALTESTSAECQAVVKSAEVGTQTSVSLPSRVSCMWQGHVIDPQTVVDMDSGNADRQIESELRMGGVKRMFWSVLTKIYGK